MMRTRSANSIRAGGQKEPHYEAGYMAALFNLVGPERKECLTIGERP